MKIAEATNYLEALQQSRSKDISNFETSLILENETIATYDRLSKTLRVVPELRSLIGDEDYKVIFADSFRGNVINKLAVFGETDIYTDEEKTAMVESVVSLQQFHLILKECEPFVSYSRETPVYFSADECLRRLFAIIDGYPTNCMTRACGLRAKTVELLERVGMNPNKY